MSSKYLQVVTKMLEILVQAAKRVGERGATLVSAAPPINHGGKAFPTGQKTEISTLPGGAKAREVSRRSCKSVPTSTARRVGGLRAKPGLFTDCGCRGMAKVKLRELTGGTRHKGKSGPALDPIAHSLWLLLCWGSALTYSVRALRGRRGVRGSAVSSTRRSSVRVVGSLSRLNVVDSAAQGSGIASGEQHTLVRNPVGLQPDLTLRRRSRPQPPSLAQGIAGFVVSVGTCPGRLRTGETRAARPPSGFQVLAKGGPSDSVPTEYASLVRRG
eukprot:bmy_05248T0